MQQQHSVCRLILIGSVASVLCVLASPAPAGVCGPGNGGCCEINGSPGCEDEECCKLICGIDPFCCKTTWDTICADQAIALCNHCPKDCSFKGGSDNDDCEDAFTINEGDTVEGNSCCTNDGTASCGNSGNSPDVWYAYTATVNGEVAATTCADFKDYDTVLSVHSGCPGTVGNEIVCNDDDCDLNIVQSAVTWSVSAGTTYLIRVAGFGGACGDFDLTLAEVSPCDCDDGDPCTDDFCGDGRCDNPEIDCDDGDPCTDNFCIDGECQAEANDDCCEGCGTCDGDVNCDGVVDPLDVGAVMARFGLDGCDAENCKYDLNCTGTIDPLDSGYVAARFGVCNDPDACYLCGEDIFNDHCEDAPVDTLNVGETLSYEGDNTEATMTCAAGGFPETWHAFDLTEQENVITSLCGTDPPFGNAYIVIDQSCPCSGDFIFANSFDQTTCDDGNWALHYNSLPSGVYYTPVLMDETSTGKYTWNIFAGHGHGEPTCGPGNGDCCIEGGNGTPGCDDEECCSAICAADSFCCDTEWDGICADAAQASCDICGGG